MGQIYTRERYEGRTARRTHTVGGKAFVEETVPVESVAEYFEHFSVLEIDYTFYAPLLDGDFKPTQTYHVLRRYREHMGEADRVVLKVPQGVSAQKLRKGGRYLPNETYLNAAMFLELRTEGYLSAPVFQVLEKHGVGQVLSHWTWLPPLGKQLAKAGHRVFNGGKTRLVRLMTPIGTRYEDAYAKAHPFDKLVEGMLQPQMVLDAAALMRRAVDEEVQTMILINNRAGGNAPLIAQRVVDEFLKGKTVPRQ
jgi:uncharacterized protein YecE (DUF72 family)